MKYLILISLFLISQFAHSAGMVQMTGTVTSFTPEYVMIRNQSVEYTIERNKLGKQQNHVSLKPGQKITLTIPFGSFKRVKSTVKRH